jgi:hypothetical protein
MSRKRVRWLIAVLLVFAIALTALWWFYLRPPYGITQRSFARIQKGMTLEELEGVIGIPPDRDVLWQLPFPKGVKFESIENWTGQDRRLTVFLDANKVVVYKNYSGPDAQDFLSRLLEMFGL